MSDSTTVQTLVFGLYTVRDRMYKPSFDILRVFQLNVPVGSLCWYLLGCVGLRLL